MQAQEPVLLSLANSTLVFGLDWFPLLGAQAQRQSKRLARRYRASHLVFSGEQVAAVGLVSLRLRGTARKQQHHSAAQVLAGLFPNSTVALILPLPGQQGWWMAAVHQGTVIARTDRRYPSLELAVVALDDLRLAYPQLRYLDASNTDTPTLSQIESSLGQQSALHKVVRWNSVLPLPVQLFVLILLLVLLLPKMWQGWREKAVSASPVAHADAGLLWQQAIAQAVQSRFLHGVPATHALLESFYQLPVNLAGWQLNQAECIAGASRWACSASYLRQTRWASNYGFLNLTPTDWTSRFPSMDLVRVAWSVPVGTSPLANQALKATADIDRHWLSELQAIRPAFTQMTVGQPVVVPVAAPLNQQGLPLPRPDGLPMYAYRSVQINGPLRSFALVLPHVSAMQWRRALLTLSDNAPATLASSQLSVSFQGDLYETPSQP